MQKMGDNYGNKFLAAALGLVALIALGLAWAFRLEPVGEQGLNFGYYRNRWTGTMYTRCGDTIETRTGREKRLERERAEEEARKAIERERETARLELERIQKEKEDKAAAVKAEEEWQKTTALLINGKLLLYRDNEGSRYDVPPDKERDFRDDAMAKSIEVSRVTLWRAGTFKERTILYKSDGGKYFDVPESLKSDFLSEAVQKKIRCWRVYEPRKGEQTLYYIGANQMSFTIAESDEKEFLEEAKERNCRVWKK